MPKGRPLTQAEIREAILAIEKTRGNKREAAQLLGIGRSTLYQRLDQMETAPEPPEPSPYATEHRELELGTSQGTWEITSTPDNKFRFAAFGDLHAGSKYARWDVREDLTRRAEKFRAMAILDTGNWIDGEASFNRYDLEVVGLEMQLQMLATRYPKTRIPTYAVTGADHEGWYVKREGIDVGRNCEAVMRAAGHPWTNLGYMQADILLRNANSKAVSILRVMHPGGGSAYALSYKPQKIIEAMEGGEKPAVLLIGHYHKIDFGLVRNVFYCQTGTSQDQTPFLAQKGIEVHVGGFLIEMEQDPETGARPTKGFLDMAQSSRFRGRRTSTTRRYRPDRRFHPETGEGWFDDDEIEIVLCVCGEKE